MSNTQPEQIVDKNGKLTTVHKGKSSKGAHLAPGAARIKLLTKPKSPITEGETFSYFGGEETLEYTVESVSDKQVIATAAPSNGYGMIRQTFDRKELEADLNKPRHSAKD